MTINTKTIADRALHASGSLYSVSTGVATRGTQQAGGWGVVIISSNKYTVQVVKTLSGSKLKATEIEMELTAAIAALSLLPADSAPALVSSYSDQLVTGMNKWRHVWAANNWLTADGKPVVYRQLWEALIAVSRRREVAWEQVRDDEFDEKTETAGDLALSAIDLMLSGIRA